MSHTSSNRNWLLLSLILSASLNILYGFVASAGLYVGAIAASTTGSASDAADMMNLLSGVIACCPVVLNLPVVAVGGWLRGGRFAGGWTLGMLIGFVIGGSAVALTGMAFPAAP